MERLRSDFEQNLAAFMRANERAGESHAAGAEAARAFSRAAGRVLRAWEAFSSTYSGPPRARAVERAGAVAEMRAASCDAADALDALALAVAGLRAGAEESARLLPTHTRLRAELDAAQWRRGGDGVF